MTWYSSTCGIMIVAFTIRVNFMVKYVCVGFGSNSFVTKTQLFPTDGHYRIYIINGVSKLSHAAIVLCTVAVQWLGHRHYTIGPSGQRQPY
jgi:hypothetical protein